MIKDFLVFVFIVIFLFNYKIKITSKRKFLIFVLSWFIGGLFYLPIWFENGFALDWLTAVTPNDQGLLGLIARFFYKIFCQSKMDLYGRNHIYVFK